MKSLDNVFFHQGNWSAPLLFVRLPWGFAGTVNHWKHVLDHRGEHVTQTSHSCHTCVPTKNQHPQKTLTLLQSHLHCAIDSSCELFKRIIEKKNPNNETCSIMFWEGGGLSCAIYLMKILRGPLDFAMWSSLGR